MKQFVLILVFLVSLAMSSSPAFADSDYKYLDEDGNDVPFTVPDEFYTATHPGPWPKEPPRHKVKFHTHIRNEGLEHIRILAIEIPHPMQDAKAGNIEKIYLLDKDNLVVGYRAFTDQDKKVSFHLKLNGIINYLKIYIVCSQHGIWMEELRF